MGFITILAENNLTSLFQVKEGADCQKLSIIALTRDRMTMMMMMDRGRPKAGVLLSAETESRPKVT